MEVYDRPVNKFVAGFLGTPPMNFFDGRVEVNNGKTTFIVNENKILLPESHNECLADYNNSQMVLGIRPERLSTEPVSGQNSNSLAATVNVVEPLGDRMDVYLTTDTGHSFIANINPHIKLNAGDSITVYLDANWVFIFQPGDTGKNVVLGAMPN